MKESVNTLEKQVYPEMYSYIPPVMEASRKRNKRHPALKVLPLLSIAGAGIIFSLLTNNLFMKELVLSGLFFFMILLIRVADDVA